VFFGCGGVLFSGEGSIFIDSEIKISVWEGLERGTSLRSLFQSFFCRKVLRRFQVRWFSGKQRRSQRERRYEVLMDQSWLIEKIFSLFGGHFDPVFPDHAVKGYTGNPQHQSAF